MYSKEMSSALRRQFFTALGQYMLPIPSADGMKVNWQNYKTGVKFIFFRMETPNRGVQLALELTHPDDATRLGQFELLKQLRPVFESEAGKDWTWEDLVLDEHGKKTSRIFVRLGNVSVLNQNDWPEIISFLKSRLVSLDAFWCLVKDQFSVS